MRSNCKMPGCNNPVWSDKLCINHKPRKKLLVTRSLNKGKMNSTKDEEYEKMRTFFKSIWDKKPHKSEISGDYIGPEPLSIYFHHILPKEKHPEAKFDEDNIILLTWQEHDQVEMDIFRFHEINERRNTLKAKYEGA